MDLWLRDAKHGLKLLIKDKSFTLAAVLTLGLAIGANVAIFTIIQSVLLKPLPFAESDRLVTIFNSYPNVGAGRSDNGVPDYFDRLEVVTAFESLAVYDFENLSLEKDGVPVRIRGMQATPSLFEVLGVEAQEGRTFIAEEGEPGQDQVALISHGMWQEDFAGDAAIIGSEIRVDGVLRQIVGVMPQDFQFMRADTRLWIPHAFTAEQRSDDNRHSNFLSMMGRLAPGASLEQAKEQIDALNAGNLERFPNFKELLIDAGFTTHVASAQADLVRNIRPTLLLLWGGVLIVLIISCVNLVNLVLVRSTARLKELSTRCALGASRGHVLRQLLVEHTLLTFAGGGLGVLLGYAALQSSSLFGLDSLPRSGEIHIDSTVILVTLVTSLLIGSGLGMIPALRVLGADLNAVLREEGRGGSVGRGARFLGRALVTAQVGFAFVLLIGAGLLLVSFQRILDIDPGFDTEGRLAATVVLPEARYSEPEHSRTFLNRTLSSLEALPGVVRVAASSVVPFGSSFNDSVIVAEGYVMQPGESVISPTSISVTAKYFETMGVDLLEGRFFDERDRAGGHKTLIIDELLARRFWGDESPIGRRMLRPDSPEDLVEPGPDSNWYEIVGVVRSMRLKGLVEGDESVGAYFFPLDQEPSGRLTFTLETAVSGEALFQEMRAKIAAIDPQLPVFDARSMEERLEASLADRRTPMLLASGFGAVALFLAGIGLYGVLAYLVTRRHRELGIRLALGSSHLTVFRLVIQEGAAIAGIGLLLGMGGALALQDLLATHLYGIEPMEPTVLAGVAAVLTAVALLACAIPGWRAARIDPAIILRE